MDEPLQSLIDNAQIHDHNSQVVAEHILSYYSEMNDVEKGQVSLDMSNLPIEILKKEIGKQKKVYQKYWSREDDYWEPCSLSNEERYSPQAITHITVMSDGNGEFIVTLTYQHESNSIGNGPLVYIVRSINEKPKIVNRFF